MKKKLILPLLCFLVVQVLLASASRIESQEPRDDVFFQLTDSYQREVVLVSQPERIISIGPNITEIIYALGAGDLMVGRSDYCDYPLEVLDLESIGDLLDPSLEKILELDPDLVIVSTHVSLSVVQAIEQAGITTAAVFTDETFEGVFNTIRTTAGLVGADHAADEMIHGMQITLEEVSSRITDAPRPRVYYVVDFGPWGDFTAGGNTFIHELIKLAGGDNIASEVSGWSYSLERIMEQDPDMLVCSDRHDMKSRLQQAHGYRDLRAVQEDQVFEIDANLLDRQGVRNARGVLELARIFHPDRFE